MRGWLIIGAGGHARSIASIIWGRGDYVEAVSDPSFYGMTPETRESTASFEPFRRGRTAALTFFGDDQAAMTHAKERSLTIALAIGDNLTRQRVGLRILQSLGMEALASPLVAISATVDPTAELGAFAQVGEHAHVGPLARVGSCTVINTAAVVEHDSVVGDGCHLAPGATLLGMARVGNSVFVGSGARILPGLSVGDLAVLGAGTVVTRNLPGRATYVGVPARALPATKGSNCED